MPRDVLGPCRDCGAGPEDPCMCDAVIVAPAICEECTGCQGDGRVLVRPLGSSATSPDCDGSGLCPACDGTGRMAGYDQR